MRSRPKHVHQPATRQNHLPTQSMACRAAWKSLSALGCRWMDACKNFLHIVKVGGVYQVVVKPGIF